MDDVWAAATAAADKRRQDRIDAARSQLTKWAGDDVALPGKVAVVDLGVVFHDGTRGLLVNGQQVRYVPLIDGGEISSPSAPLATLADLGALLQKDR